MNQVIIGSGSTASEGLSTQQAVGRPSTVVIPSEPQADPQSKLPTAPTTEQAAPAQNKEVNPAEQQHAEDTQETPVFEIAGLDMSELSKEYETTGALSAESYKELAENGFPQEVVDAYIRGVKASVSESGELAKKDVDSIISEVGGLSKYEQVMSWAATKLTPQEQESYNRAVTAKDPAVARLVVQGLFSRYEREYGHAPTLVEGGRSSPVSAGFSNRSDMVAAMSDKRYGKDPDYTREVEVKVINSGLMRSGKRGRA